MLGAHSTKSGLASANRIAVSSAANDVNTSGKLDAEFIDDSRMNSSASACFGFADFLSSDFCSSCALRSRIVRPHIAVKRASSGLA